MSDLLGILPLLTDAHSARALAIRSALFSPDPTRRQLEVALRHVAVIRPHVPAGFDLETIADALQARLETAAAPAEAIAASQLELFGRVAA